MQQRKKEAKVAGPLRESIMLFTSTRCEECEKFKPEWLKFLEEFKHYEHLFPPDFIRHTIYNPSAHGAAEQRKEILQYAEEGKDGYPLLLMYINVGGKTTPDIRRWKPYWFNSRIFRTCKALVFAFLIVYKICPALCAVPPEIRQEILCHGVKRKTGDEEKFREVEDMFCDERSCSVLDEKTKEGIYYLTNWSAVKKDMQQQLDTLHTKEEREHKNYPTVDRILHLGT